MNFWGCFFTVAGRFVALVREKSGRLFGGAGGGLSQRLSFDGAHHGFCRKFTTVKFWRKVYRYSKDTIYVGCDQVRPKLD